jgi:hypothetical protein
MQRCHPGIDLPPILIEKNDNGEIIYDETEEVKKLMEERGYDKICMPEMSISNRSKVVAIPTRQ